VPVLLSFCLVRTSATNAINTTIDLKHGETLPEEQQRWRRYRMEFWNLDELGRLLARWRCCLSGS